ncbi:universal stress protein [Chryseolinea sp. H1M3-3]|uniref:universal stress protein n=1 Tax=Chryseolinea sp. H1M3-3 TaxID=3034144 RepID=UPI0023EA8F99|nr:universal stress protein [Chryseolinea sp. H1M3-3]
MKLLVPTDFSDNAFHAAMYAVTLANEKPGSSIHLIHVLTPILNDPIVIHDIEDEATKSLIKIKAELKSRCTNCRITHSVQVGDMISEVNKTIEALNIGLVIMGIQGLGKTSRFFFGSNSRSLINKSTCPVIVIPETTIFKKPEKIVFATDYYDSDLDALLRLVPIATPFNSEIIVVHVFDENEEAQSEESMIEFISNEIFKTVDYPRISYRVYYNKDTSQGLKNFCDFTGADLLVLSARKQNIFQKIFGKSITKDLVYHSDIPLLVFHVHKMETSGVL